MYGQLGLIVFDPVYALGLRDSCEARCVGRLTTCKANLLEDRITIMTLLRVCTRFEDDFRLGAIRNFLDLKRGALITYRYRCAPFSWAYIYAGDMYITGAGGARGFLRLLLAGLGMGDVRFNWCVSVGVSM